MLDDEEDRCFSIGEWVYVFVILIFLTVLAIGSICILVDNIDAKHDYIVGQWTSENVFGEDFEHMVVVCSSDNSGYITKNNVTLPLRWEHRPFGSVLCISDNFIISVAVSHDASYMIYKDTYEIKLYRVDNGSDLI